MPPPSYARATWLFLRLLGLIYLIAFWSLATQILGLAGHDGILPADRYMTAAHTLDGISRYWMLPTLTWISASDAFLRALCIGGAALAALLIAGILPALVLPLLWLAYLSLSVVCGEFLSYQWDALLLEAGFLAIFLAPWTVRERARAPADPPRIVVWLFLWLLFRLMVGSGAVKLTSGDAAWRGLTALTVHFETQPIPTPLAWYAHWLPAWMLKASTVIVFAIELLAPWFMVTTRRLRRWAFVPLVALQIVIALSGNYAFFNLLTAALCVFLIDDAAWGAWGPGDNIAIDHRPDGRARNAVVVALAVVVVPVSAVTFAGSLGIRIPGAVLVDPLADLVAPFRSINAYGLFAVMTTTRPEIVIEGSDDGETWLAYEFRYKAGDVHRPPPWVAPHQPRLDWQMWFAALGQFDSEPWFQDFCVRLLQADNAVLKLLARDPFDGRPPRYVRGVLYQYLFADRATWQREHVWWVRQRVGDYSPVLSLQAR